MNYLAQFSYFFKDVFLVCSSHLPSHKIDTLNKDFRLHLLQRSSFSFQCMKKYGYIMKNWEPSLEMVSFLIWRIPHEIDATFVSYKGIEYPCKD